MRRTPSARGHSGAQGLEAGSTRSRELGPQRDDALPPGPQAAEVEGRVAGKPPGLAPGPPGGPCGPRLTEGHGLVQPGAAGPAVLSRGEQALTRQRLRDEQDERLAVRPRLGRHRHFVSACRQLIAPTHGAEERQLLPVEFEGASSDAHGRRAAAAQAHAHTLDPRELQGGTQGAGPRTSVPGQPEALRERRLHGAGSDDAAPYS